MDRINCQLNKLEVLESSKKNAAMAMMLFRRHLHVRIPFEFATFSSKNLTRNQQRAITLEKSEIRCGTNFFYRLLLKPSYVEIDPMVRSVPRKKTQSIEKIITIEQSNSMMIIFLCSFKTSAFRTSSQAPRPVRPGRFFLEKHGEERSGLVWNTDSKNTHVEINDKFIINHES